MQPYFFPYLGYFDLIRFSDRWIIFDEVQFIRHGWLNRNRILHPQQGWQYVIVPVQKHHRDTAIKDIVVSPHADWRSRLLGQIAHYKNKAPHYGEVRELVEECLRIDETSLSRLNGKILKRLCDHIGIEMVHEHFQDMHLNIGQVEKPGDWALRISVALGASEYVNPPGGVDLFDPADFSAAGIKLTIRSPPVMEYDTRGYRFEPGLSIIDVLMWNSPEVIMNFLSQHQ